MTNDELRRNLELMADMPECVVRAPAIARAALSHLTALEQERDQELEQRIAYGEAGWSLKEAREERDAFAARAKELETALEAEVNARKTLLDLAKLWAESAARLAECQDVLRGVEWGTWEQRGPVTEVRVCPVCRKEKRFGHDADCRLAACLQPAASEPKDSSTCPRCEGTGKYSSLGEPARECAVCGGTGKIVAEPVTVVPWPPGVKEAINDAIQAGKAEAAKVPDPDRGKVVREQATVLLDRPFATPWEQLRRHDRDSWNEIYDAVLADARQKEQRL